MAIVARHAPQGGISSSDDQVKPQLPVWGAGAIIVLGCRSRAAWEYGRMNPLVSVLIRILEAMFVAGVIGSAIVVILTSIEDFKMLFEKEPSRADRNNGT
jgi:hypothetical protein